VREIAVMVPIVLLIFWMGLHPRSFIAISEQPIANLLHTAKAPDPRVKIQPGPKSEPVPHSESAADGAPSVHQAIAGEKVRK